MDSTYTLTVNGQKHKITSPPLRTLLDVLREDLHLTGAKFGCGEGECGACSVLQDGRRIFACQTSLDQVGDKPITTVEALSHGDTLHPVQQAFQEENAFQCGYCTPGMIMATCALLNDNPKPNDDEILDAMNNNLCRCCAYANILGAVRKAAQTSPSPTASK